jgi:hypothetical protein
MIPTTNFMAFSGTRANGARTAIPAMVTTSTAASAATAASGMLCWLAPNVSAMKTTSRPSSTTPLNDSVNEYQSATIPRRPTGAAWAAASSAA